MRAIILLLLVLSANCFSQEETGNPPTADEPTEQSATEPESVVAEDAQERISATTQAQPEVEEAATDCSQCASTEADSIAAQDLIEQTWMAWGTWAIAFLTLVTVVLVWMTYGEAQKANAILGGATKTQLRAYMAVSGAHIEALGSEGFGVRIEWINKGETPAIRVRIGARWVLSTKETLTEAVEELHTATGNIDNGIDVAPDATVDIAKKKPMTYLEFKAAFHGTSNSRLLVHTFVYYSDIYGHRYAAAVVAKLKIVDGRLGGENGETRAVSIRPISPYIAERDITKTPEEEPTPKKEELIAKFTGKISEQELP